MCQGTRLVKTCTVGAGGCLLHPGWGPGEEHKRTALPSFIDLLDVAWQAGLYGKGHK